MNTNVYVILPNTAVDFLANGVRYNEDGELKVVWLLHGMGDDYTGWLRYSNLERYALARGIAVVCPSVHAQCFYSNMTKGLAYYDYIADELPAFMKETFPQFSQKREDNYVAGLSMGGYGALKFGLSRPDQYCRIGCLSGGNFIEMQLPPEDEAEDFLTPFYGGARNAFGTEKLGDAAGTEHDLKHLLLALRGVIDPNEYDSMLETINSYGAEIQTNNEVLDVVFQEKNFRCRKLGIQFTCIIDGSAVDFMGTTDQYILFGNLLDNAIEAVSQLPEGEVKNIQVTVRRDKGFVIITTENGYAGELQWDGGRPRTSKTDKQSHGYGILSIEKTVHKYGGRYSISTEDHIFTMNIVLPAALPAAKRA